ncbi:hypothetical protein CROQUDRAFT_70309 [Cronartium quercuum f. sp. fusiforme G11]|uniref:Uncharacterized protein n=1 Tax=Cronartium quercuum f. sp. fusiforme G11 TaxID=708437 RepID=A0A9P6T524_9BASI|nr:hypothetical protein CROQUDRAFT_70309 [Cronartium quercuum f. sp. fusiforme G11]
MHVLTSFIVENTITERQKLCRRIKIELDFHFIPFSDSSLDLFVRIYWVGPTLGALLAVTIYVIMKRFKYWKLNAGQDTDESYKSPALFIQEDPKKAGAEGSWGPSAQVVPSIGQTIDGGAKDHPRSGQATVVQENV